MGSMNRTFLMGNLTRDPELRMTSTGRAVADLRLAVSEKFRNRDGEMSETALFIDVVTWGSKAENCAQYLQKGSAVLVEGRLRLDEWENDNGEKRSRIRVRADRVQFLGGPRSKEASAEENWAGGAGVEE